MLSRRVRAISVLLVGLGLAQVEAVDPFRVVGQTNAPGLRVRTEANLESATLGNLPDGVRMEVIGVTAQPMTIGSNTSRWYEVRPLPGGSEPAGWSYGAFIDIEPADRLALAIWGDQAEFVQEIPRHRPGLKTPGLALAPHKWGLYQTLPGHCRVECGES